MIFPVLLAKFLSAGAVAQAATGAGVVVIAFTGAGAAGALPAPVQDTFSTVVAAVSPLKPPTSGATGETPEQKPGTVPVTLPEDAETVTTEDAGDVEVLEVDEEAEATEAYVKAWALKEPDGSQSFTAWVHEGNQDHRVKDWLRAHGMSFGDVVSARASGKGFSEEELAVLGVDVGGVADAPTAPESDEDVTDTETETETVQTEQTTAGAATEDRGSRGNGNGNGRSEGKSKGNGKN